MNPVVSTKFCPCITCRPNPALGCQVTPTPADVCSDSCRLHWIDPNAFKPAHMPTLSPPIAIRNYTCRKMGRLAR